MESKGSGRGWKLGMWTALDVTATLGSVGGAVAFILTQELMLVGLPVLLPLLALYASRQRESAAVEARPTRLPVPPSMSLPLCPFPLHCHPLRKEQHHSQVVHACMERSAKRRQAFDAWESFTQGALAEVRGAWQATGMRLESQGAAEAARVTAALEQLREDLAAALPAGKLRGMEGKLAALEGSVLSAGAGAPISCLPSSAQR